MFIQDVPMFWPRSLTTLWILSPSERCDWPVMRHKQWLGFEKTKLSIFIDWSIYSVVRERSPKNADGKPDSNVA